MTDLGPWRLVERTRRLTGIAGQGMATVRADDGSSQVVYRGVLSIPLRLRLGRQWVHIGDPGSYDGFLVACYQGPDAATAKMFEVRTPDGGHADFVHALAPGELMNNSFVAVSPDGRYYAVWMTEIERKGGLQGDKMIDRGVRVHDIHAGPGEDEEQCPVENRGEGRLHVDSGQTQSEQSADETCRFVFDIPATFEILADERGVAVEELHRKLPLGWNPIAID